MDDGGWAIYDDEQRKKELPVVLWLFCYRGLVCLLIDWLPGTVTHRFCAVWSLQLTRGWCQVNRVCAHWAPKKASNWSPAPNHHHQTVCTIATKQVRRDLKLRKCLFPKIEYSEIACSETPKTKSKNRNLEIWEMQKTEMRKFGGSGEAILDQKSLKNHFRESTALFGK